MPIEVRVPRLPESVADATLVAWHKQAGEEVHRDETLVDLETDKVVLEVPAPQNGRLREVFKRDGDTVTSDELLAVIEPEGVAAEPAAESAAQAVQATAVPVQSAGAQTAAAEVRRRPQTVGAPEPAQEVEPAAGPAVRRLLAEHRLDPHQIKGTGRGGRVTKEDVLRFIEGRGETAQPAESSLSRVMGQPGGQAGGTAREQQASAPQGRQAKPEAPASLAPRPTEVADLGLRRPERRVQMTRLRTRIAERLVEAQHTAAILTTINEIDMQAVMDLRKRYRERFEQQHGARLGMMSFFVKACVEALRRFPIVNASVDGSDIVYHDYYDIGIAVDSPRGLVVPVLRDADRLSCARIETGIAEFAGKAKEGTLSIDDLSGGTFSITNGGVFGSLVSTPILNPPQSAILGMHKIQDRPVVVQGEIRVRPMMYVALSYDHRIIDGRDAVRFLATVKESVEDPARLLLQV